MARVLTNLRPREIRERSIALANHVKERQALGLAVADHLNSMSSDPKEQLKYRAVFSVIIQLEQAPFELEDIREVLVWGEDVSDPKAFVEFKLHKPMSRVQLAAFHLDRQALERKVR